MSRRIRILCIAISILGAAWAGYSMYHRTGEQLLWGHRPLLLFLALWALVQGLLAGRKNGAIGWRQMGLSSLSGLLLGLGFPGIVPAPLLMFVGFVPLLWLESEISNSEGKGKGRRVFLHSYNAFLLWNILSTWWVANTALAAGIVAMALNSLFMALVFTAFHHTKHRMPRIAGAAFMAFWMAFEYLHLNWEITWPWLTLGNAFAQFPALVQWYEFTGVFGGSLWILAGNWLIFRAWKQRDDRAALRSSVVKIALWLFIPLAVSLWQYFSYKEQGDKTVQVALVQPNYEPHYEKFDIPEDVQMQRFLELSASITDANTDYLVWPETSFGYVETRSMESYPAVVQLRGFMAKYPQLKVIAGIDAYHIFLPGEPHSKAVRSSSSGGGTMFFEVLNAAAQFSNESEEVQLYRKSKLVPGPEILPYRRFFGIFEPVIKAGARHGGRRWHTKRAHSHEQQQRAHGAGDLLRIHFRRVLYRLHSQRRAGRRHHDQRRLVGQLARSPAAPLAGYFARRGNPSQHSSRRQYRYFGFHQSARRHSAIHPLQRSRRHQRHGAPQRPG
jgi:apolipoprotein N-acyltransferase